MNIYYLIATISFNLCTLVFIVWSFNYGLKRKNFYTDSAQYIIDSFYLIFYPSSIIVITTHLYFTDNLRKRIIREFNTSLYSMCPIKTVHKLAYFAVLFVTLIVLASDIITYAILYGWDGSKYLFGLWCTQLLQILLLLHVYYFTLRVNEGLSHFTKSLDTFTRKFIHNKREFNAFLFTLRDFIKLFHAFINIINLINKRSGIVYLTFLFLCSLHATRMQYFMIVNLVRDHNELIIINCILQVINYMVRRVFLNY